MTYSDAIIKRLTDLCVERGITTNKLATLSGITQSTLNSMMRGETKNPKLKTLRKIAMGFNMTVSELLDFPEMNVQIAIQNGHLCHVRRSVCDIIGGQPKTN